MNDASELTTRDVLQQIDRRLTAVEEGLRAQGAELRAEIAALRAEFRAEMTSGFRWLVGLILVSWLSIMGMMLPLLLRQ